LRIRLDGENCEAAFDHVLGVFAAKLGDVRGDIHDEQWIEAEDIAELMRLPEAVLAAAHAEHAIPCAFGGGFGPVGDVLELLFAFGPVDGVFEFMPEAGRADAVVIEFHAGTGGWHEAGFAIGNWF
jgi:uncharacterized protein YukJ